MIGLIIAGVFCVLGAGAVLLLFARFRGVRLLVVSGALVIIALAIFAFRMAYVFRDADARCVEVCKSRGMELGGETRAWPSGTLLCTCGTPACTTTIEVDP